MNMINNQDSISDRLTYLFSVLGMRQTDVAKRLRLADASVSNWISGKTQPSAQTVSQIAKEFSVNEEWLTTGKGEMFISVTKQEQLSVFFNNLLHDKNQRKLDFILALASLSENEWNALTGIIKTLSEI